jgi:hypothetical protein
MAEMQDMKEFSLGIGNQLMQFGHRELQHMTGGDYEEEKDDQKFITSTSQVKSIQFGLAKTASFDSLKKNKMEFEDSDWGDYSDYESSMQESDFRKGCKELICERDEKIK